MNKSNKIIVGTGFVAVVAIIVAIYFHNKFKEEQELVKELEKDNLKLIFESINENDNLTNEVQSQLKDLIIKFEKLNIKVSNKIAKALQLVQIGQTENAIEDLSNVVENLLKEKYKSDEKYKIWLGKRKEDFHNRLEFCKKSNQINKIEFDFFVAIKSIRNAENHELDLNLPNYLNASGLIVGIGAIYKVASLIYPENQNI